MGKGRRPCCDKAGVKKGPWSQAEDFKLISFVQKYGHNNWRALPKLAGLARCGKSCRLRWVNYLRPDLKRGDFTPQEEEVIIKLHEALGNKWSKIASHFPGRTDNEIKNVWNTHLKKRLKDKYKCSSKDSCNVSSSTTNTPNEITTIEGCNNQQQHSNKQVLTLQKSDTSNDTIEYSSSSSTSSNSQASFSDHQMMAENNVEHHPNKDETSACEGKNIENSSLDELIEIPFEPNLDLWDLLHGDNNKDVQFNDVDTPILFENDNKNENTNIKQGDHHGSWWWLVYLENELGLDHLNQSTPLQSTTNHTSSTHDLDFISFLIHLIKLVQHLIIKLIVYSMYMYKQLSITNIQSNVDDKSKVGLLRFYTLY